MLFRLGETLRALGLVGTLAAATMASGFSLASWRGVVRDDAGKPVATATVKLTSIAGGRYYVGGTSANGAFAFPEIVAGEYELSVESGGKTWGAERPVVVVVKDGALLSSGLELSSHTRQVRLVASVEAISVQSSGGEHLSSGEVSSLPLNARDFSKLLLLAAGTMTDTNGAANFTQQFAVNGQRGTATVFALDNADTTDPELGGATFSSFNVDAIQEVQSNSGVMPADTGHGAAGFTNVVTKSGSNQVHGSLFEFVRNAAFDARNFFDHKSDLSTRRLPPFSRNEFGVTNGGPVVLPRIFDGRGKTFYFAEYQG